MTREELELQFPVGSFVRRDMGTHVEKLQVVGYDDGAHIHSWCYLRVKHVEDDNLYGFTEYTFFTDNPQPYGD